MNEEKYTRNSAKKSTRKKKVNPDIHAGKSHGEKLKNDSSAARSYRDKIRYGKKDNSLSVSEAKELCSMKKQGRRRIYRNQAVAATVRKTTIKNEDDNSGTDSLNAGLAAVEAGIGKVREHGQARKYSSKIHNRSDHLDAVQGAKGAKEAGEAGESTMSATVKKTHKKLMQREFAEAAAKKQARTPGIPGSGRQRCRMSDFRNRRRKSHFGEGLWNGPSRTIKLIRKNILLIHPDMSGIKTSQNRKRFRNGMRLEPNASEIIEPGDEIGIGKLKFIYR